MRSQIRAILILGCLPLLMAGTARGGYGVAVKITNDDTDDILVTVYDMNASPQQVVLSERINGFASVPISVAGDDTGQATLAWTATTIDPVFKKCGHATSVVGNSASVKVHADSSCSA
jgi:hypothetical protein